MRTAVATICLLATIASMIRGNDAPTLEGRLWWLIPAAVFAYGAVVGVSE
jgi:hypothetical protein